jgi:hypothetical protein
VANLASPWQSRDDNSGTANMRQFQSKPVGMNAPVDPLSSNQPPKQRPFGQRNRMGNRPKKLAGG